MSEPDTELGTSAAVTVGRILGPHGIHGELRVQSLTDFPERFEPGERLWLDGREVVIGRSRWERGRLLLKLAGIDSRDEAEQLRSHELLVSAPRADLAEGQYYRHDVIGLSAFAGDTELGRVVDILETGANDVYVIRSERGELLLPAIGDVIKDVDLERRRILVELLPGLEFEPKK